MKVILNNDVTNLGEEGDICTVAPGYARNFLLPKGLVMEYNAHNLARIEERRVEIEERRTEKRKSADGLRERLETEALVISMTAGINGKLFGSVTAATIAEQLASTGITVERKRIEIPDHSLKAVGNYKIRIKLYADQEAILTVKVEAANARELEEKRARLGSRDPAAVAAEESRQPEQEDDNTAVEPEQDDDNTAVEPEQDDDNTAVESSQSTDPEVIAMEQAVREEETGAVDEDEEFEVTSADSGAEQDTDDPDTR